jgi:gluconolactonase
MVLDPAFAKYKVNLAAIQRLYTGCLWAEGPTWNAEGRYLVWSDVPNNRQMRWLDEDGHVSVFHSPSANSNGNTFDYEGRLVSCEQLTRRVVRYELNGSLTVLADTYQGKRLNSPNDIVVHPDGGIWFSDPTYGITGNYQGNKATPELKQAIYRIDPKTKEVALVTDDPVRPNGLCFSPDYKKLYVIDSDDATPQGIRVFDVVDSVKLANNRKFCSMAYNGKEGRSDGARCDTDGNIWAVAGWLGDGYDGVFIFSPEGKLIGRIGLPEVCANVCFGGPKRNRLFMAASQSLYALYVNTQGAHIS